MINNTIFNTAKDITPTAWTKFKAKATDITLRLGEEIDANKSGTVTAICALGSFLLLGDILEQAETQTVIAAIDAGLI